MRRLLRLAVRRSSIWLVVPVLVGIDFVIGVDRGMPWRGELAWCAESMVPAVVLQAPVLAAVGAWEAHHERLLDVDGLLRSPSDGWRAPTLRLAGSATIAALLQLVVTAVMFSISLAQARIGAVPWGSVLLQVVTLYACVGIGALISKVVPGLVGVVVAAACGFGLAYADYLTRLPIGLVGDGATETLLGYREGLVAVFARCLWCAAIVGAAWLVGTFGYAVRPRLRMTVASGVLLGLTIGCAGLVAQPVIWSPAPHPPTASACTATVPRVCVLPPFRSRLNRVAALAVTARHLLESTGASGLPDSYIGVWPTTPRGVAVVDVISPDTADQPASATDIAAGLVAPTSCSVWTDPIEGPSTATFETQTLLVAWLGEQDPAFRPSGPTRVDLKPFLDAPAAAQTAWVKQAATELAECSFDHLPAPPGMA